MSYPPKTLFTNPPPSFYKHNSSPTTRNPNAKQTSTTLKGTKCCLILKQLSSTLHLLINSRRRGLHMFNSCSKWSIHLKGVSSILCRCNDVKFLLMLTICLGCTLCLTRIYKNKRAREMFITDVPTWVTRCSYLGHHILQSSKLSELLLT